MDKPQVIGLGLNGLVGSRITEILSNEYNFVSLSRSSGVDITDPSTLTKLKDFPKANIVLHLAAKADVDGCEKDKEKGVLGEAWKINVEGTRNVAEICRELGKKMVYISTDFVFNGEKKGGEFYSETDSPSPLNWYGETKYQGEKAVEGGGSDYVILRIAYPYRAKFDLKKDFMRAILTRLQEGLEVKAVTDHVFCPTFVDDVAQAIGALIKNDGTGIYHAVGSQALTPHDASVRIAEAFGLPKALISETTREEFFKDRAPRPFNLVLGNDKIQKLGVNMMGFEEGLQVIKSQLQ